MNSGKQKVGSGLVLMHGCPNFVFTAPGNALIQDLIP